MYSGFLVKAMLSLGLAKEAVSDSTLRIKDDSENAALLYYQAKGLIQLNMNDQALAIAKYACELCPESTSAWVLLAHCFFLSKDVRKALIALDMAPAYADDPLLDGVSDKQPTGLEHTKPNKRSSSDYQPKIMAVHKAADYDPTRDTVRKEEKYLMEKEDTEQMTILSHLRANQLSNSEKLIYELLALIEKQIGWEQLLRCRNEVFLKGGDNPWDLLEKSVPASQGSARVAAGEEAEEKKAAADEDEDSDGEDEEEEEEEKGKAGRSGENNKKQCPPERFNRRKSKHVCPKTEEKKEEKKGDKESVLKRVCEKLDNGLACLNDDLCAYYYWEKEETMKTEQLSIRYCVYRNRSTQIQGEGVAVPRHAGGETGSAADG